MSEPTFMCYHSPQGAHVPATENKQPLFTCPHCGAENPRLEQRGNIYWDYHYDSDKHYYSYQGYETDDTYEVYCRECWERVGTADEILKQQEEHQP